MQELPDSGLITLLQGEDPASRTRAILLLGERKATGAVVPLIGAMEDESLRPAVAEALARMKAEATPALIRLLKSPDPVTGNMLHSSSGSSGLPLSPNP